MKTKPTNEEILEDIKMFIVWNTLNVVQKKFNNNLDDFYSSFKLWNAMRNGRQMPDEDFNVVWKNMRLLNELLKIDFKLCAKLAATKKYEEIFKQLDGSIVKLNKGRICWHSKDGKMQQQQFGSRYYATQQTIEQLLKRFGSISSILDFKNGIYSKRILRIIGKCCDNNGKNTKDEKMTTRKNTKAKTQDQPKSGFPEKSQQQEFISNLQRWIDEKKLAMPIAKKMLATLGENAFADALCEPKGGFCYADIDHIAQAKIELNFVKLFKQLVEKNDDDKKYWLRECKYARQDLGI